MLVIGLHTYQQAFTSLLIDRDRQLAALSASQLSEVLTGYERELAGLATGVQVQSGLPVIVSLPGATADFFEVFTAGFMLADREGQAVQVLPGGDSPVYSMMADQPYFQIARQSRSELKVFRNRYRPNVWRRPHRKKPVSHNPHFCPL